MAPADLVSDERWEAVAPSLPPERPKPKGGRPRLPDRAARAGIVFVLRHGLRWRDLPQELGLGAGRGCGGAGCVRHPAPVLPDVGGRELRGSYWSSGGGHGAARQLGPVGGRASGGGGHGVASQTGPPPRSALGGGHGAARQLGPVGAADAAASAGRPAGASAPASATARATTPTRAARVRRGRSVARSSFFQNCLLYTSDAADEL